MQTKIRLSNHKEIELPPEFQDDDIRFPESFVRHFLKEYTQKGDIVLDPFAGYGTTLRVAEEMGRVGYGTEYDEKKVIYAKTTLKNPDNLIVGDALKISQYNLPDFDFSITSPLYMQKTHKNPFHTACKEETEYKQYLKDMKSVYAQIKGKLKDEGRAIIEVSNIKGESGDVTPLAWDIGEAVSEVLTFEGEIIIDWEDGYGYGYDHSYALVFKK